jgi:spore maturation protein CgeB/glycosyltransferase involved in cell wall biosynthesis
MQQDEREDEGFRLRLALLRERARRLAQEQRQLEADALAEEQKAEIAMLRGSLSFGLGRALLDAAKHPREIVRLPSRLASLVRTARERQAPVVASIASSPASSQQPASRANVAAATHALPVAGPAPESLRAMRVAAVLDTFSHDSLAPECDLLALHPDQWREQIATFAPHLLLVESAWQGIDGAWEGKVATCSDTLRALVAACRDAGIPTVFWNKEDPLHYEAFIETARLFDRVFTTDANCIPRYKRDLRHDRVGLMPFALQPATFHPITRAARKPGAFFAGAWYPHLTERSRDFRAIVDALDLVGDVDIYDRNHGRETAGNLVYPPEYRHMVRGGVPYAEVANLYRSHVAGINLNTIKQSPTMFARRVVELIGCGTTVYGNYALGIARLFGDLVVNTDEQEQVFREAWRELHAGAAEPRRRRAAALRKVLAEHTYAHRLAYIARQVGWKLDVPALPAVVVVARVRDANALARVLAACARQGLAPARILLDVPEALRARLPAHVEALTADALQANVDARFAGRWIAALDANDQYGAHYLEDLALATRYSDAVAIGKSDATQGDDYRPCERLVPRNALLRADACDLSLAALLDVSHDGELAFANAIRIDAFEYQRDGALANAHAPGATPIDSGIAMPDALAFAESMPAADSENAADAISADKLADAFRQGTIPAGTSVFPKHGRLEVCAKLGGQRTATLRTAVFARTALERNNTVRLCVDAMPDASMAWAVEQLAADGRVLAHAPLPAQVSTELATVEGATGYRLLLTLRGTLTRYVDAIALVERRPPPLFLPGKGRLLVVTNGYPSVGRPYRNAFVHRRVLWYRRRGVQVDVVCAIRGQETTSYAYEGVPVTLCDPSVLRETLALSHHDAIAVHFLDEGMWDAIRDAAEATRTVVWVHGADIQPYERRVFNYTTPDEHARAKRESEARQAFWQRVVAQAPESMHLVFVSRSFAQEAWSDLGMRLPDTRWQVIHNPIDDQLFAGPPKDEQARLRILSIRPHESRIYANDLVAAVIRGLSAYPEFSSIHFHLVGEGPLFDENFAGLAAFGNVKIERRLLRQDEIAALHRDNGVFLVPTRGDTQGVSRDEAMASGLVPVTNLVGAVGEFTDPGVAILAGAEDVEGMVAGIRQLLADPACFLRMSRAAASRVRAQSAADRVVDQELSALGLSRGVVESVSHTRPVGEVQPG